MPAIALAGTVLLALVLRVGPSYPLVFPGDMVNFQEGDAWFHVRTVHNLLAHFPYRSGFDPYAFYPGGQEIPTAPAWDYMLASAAWILGLGSPSAGLVDAVAAWLPAIVGALLAVPVFFLARRAFGDLAGCFAALWMAVGNGAGLWVGHLGLADHHAAEGLFALLVLWWMWLALDSGQARYGWLAGAALGLFLATRPAGIFLPAILAVTAVMAPAAAPMVLRATLAAALIFLPATGVQWSAYTWLALGAAGAAAGGTWAVDWMVRKRGWSDAARYGLMAGAAIAVAAGGWIFQPQLGGSLWFEIRRVAGFTPASRIVRTVQELQPVYRAGGKSGWRSVFHLLGSVWVLALPALAWLAAAPRGYRRPAWRLLTLWCVVVAIGGVLQARMAIYLLPVAAVLAGGACAWLAHFGPPLQRRIVTAVLALGVLAGNLPWAIQGMEFDGGVSRDWRQALVWLRDHSPEPLGDPRAWESYAPRGGRGGVRPDAGQWGVAVWWDFGYPVEAIAHRIPMSNGTQAGVEDMARFYTDTIPESAVGWLRRVGGRYVVVDSAATLFPGAVRFPAQVYLLGRHLDSYLQTLVERTGADGKVVRVYLPTYYQTMAARLFLADGKGSEGAGPWVFETMSGHGPGGRPVELIVAKHHFDTEAAAAVFLAQHPSGRLAYGCLDPEVSCVTVPAVSGLKRVFTSAAGTVKIFQVE